MSCIIEVVTKRAREVLKAPGDAEVRLWKWPIGILKNPEHTLADAGVFGAQVHEHNIWHYVMCTYYFYSYLWWKWRTTKENGLLWWRWRIRKENGLQSMLIQTCITITCDCRIIIKIIIITCIHSTHLLLFLFVPIDRLPSTPTSLGKFIDIQIMHFAT